MATEEEIKEKLSKFVKPTKYSEFRKEFDLNDPTFVDRLCFLISVGEVLIAGYNPGEITEFPEEARIITKVQTQSLDSEDRKIYYLKEHRQYVSDWSEDLDTYIIYRENARKL